MRMTIFQALRPLTEPGVAREQKMPCTFCGIADLSPRFSSPEVFWDDVRAGIADVSASIFHEAFDSFSSAPRWIEQLVQEFEIIDNALLDTMKGKYGDTDDIDFDDISHDLKSSLFACFVGGYGGGNGRDRRLRRQA